MTYTKDQIALIMRSAIECSGSFDGKCKLCSSKGTYCKPLGLSYGAMSPKKYLEHERWCPLNDFAHYSMEEYKLYKESKK